MVLYVFWTVVVVIFGLLAGLFFLRSSPAIPSNLTQLLAEISFQYLGVVGMLEDKLNRWRNRVDIASHEGRNAVVTGGNRGIGFHVVEKLLQCKFTVVLGVRNVEMARNGFAAKMPHALMGEHRLRFEHLDIGDMTSVRQFAQIVKSRYGPIDLLINNAGIMATPYETTKEGFESQMAVNYLGHFLLTHLLLPELNAAGNTERKSRVINVSSCLHLSGQINFKDFFIKSNYYPVAAYMNSKLAQVLFTRHLQDLIDRQGINVQTFVVHPGLVNTDIIQHFKGKLTWAKAMLFKPAEEGSRSIVFAAISPKLANHGGHYITNCTLQTPHKLSEDLEFCKLLFKFTCTLLKIAKFGCDQ